MIVVTLVAVSAPLLAAGQSAPSPAVLETLNRVGANLFSPKPDAAQAIGVLKGLLAADPGLAEGHMLLGIAYRVQATPELMGEAVAELRQAIALKPSLLRARLALARVYLDMARASRAREELEAALQQAPDRPEIMSLLAEAERQLANPRRAVELTRRVLARDESAVEARYYLALALLDLGQHAAAIREMQRVVKSGANPAEANLGLGTAYLEAGRVDAALAALRDSVRADPLRAQTHLQLARAYRAKRMFDAAETELKLARPSAAAGLNALYHSIEADLDMEEGLLRLQQGRFEAAAAAFERVLAENASHAAARQRLAEVHKRLKERAAKKPGGAP